MEAHRRDPLNYPGTSREDFTDGGKLKQRLKRRAGVYLIEQK